MQVVDSDTGESRWQRRDNDSAISPFSLTALKRRIESSTHNSHKECVKKVKICRQKYVQYLDINVPLNIHQTYFLFLSRCTYNYSTFLSKRVEYKYGKPCTWWLGNSDFHNLMGFTCKRMPNNILKFSVQKVFQVETPFLANMHSTSSEKILIYVHNDPNFCIWVSKTCRIVRWIQILGNNWKKVHMEKVICQTFFAN